MESIVQLPDEFRDFSKKFHSDSLFQIKHIVFPLSGKKMNPGRMITGFLKIGLCTRILTPKVQSTKENMKSLMVW